MTINNLIKKSFKTVINFPIITLFLVVFLIVSSLLTTSIVSAKTLPVMSILMTCAFLTAAVFVSGWFKVIKEAIDEDKTKNYFAIFLEGVGKNLLSTICAIILYFILFVGVVFLARFLAYHIFGGLEFLTKELVASTVNTSDFIENFNKLTLEQQSTIYGWYFTLIASCSIFNFLLLFYFPSMFFIEDKNAFLRPFLAIKNSLVFTFKNFFGVLAICALIHVIYFFIALLSTIFSSNVIISVLVLFSYIYFASITIMLLFNYYEQKSNCNNGPDSIRQDSCSDKTGEEN